MICRQDHLFSLGRELCPPDGPLPEAGEILALAGSENQRRAFLDGCTGPLSDVFRRPGHQCDIAAWDDVMDRACAALGCAGAPDLEREIAMALLRAAGPECFFGDLAEASAVHPAALDAAECRIYGEEAVRVVTGEGAIWDLGPDAAGTLLARAGDCAGDSSWHFGIGWAWAHWVSCERGDRPAALNEAVPWIEEAGLAGLDQGCERFRGRFE
jgi:hypothetical protein